MAEKLLEIPCGVWTHKSKLHEKLIIVKRISEYTHTVDMTLGVVETRNAPKMIMMLLDFLLVE